MPGRTGRPTDVLPAGLSWVAELGRGEFAVVHRVRREGVDYALKMMRAGAASSTARASFRREAALLSCLSHPGLVRIHDVGEVADRPYLVMDMVDGVPLSELIRAGELTEAQLVIMARDVAGALSAAHHAGVVHRDVKPDNILVRPDGRSTVIDFGLAVRVGGPDCEESMFAGTPTYSAPEQSGMLRRPVDGRTDLYALGVVLYEAATSRPPFAADDVGELMRRHLTTETPDPCAIRPALSADLAAIIGTLLQKDPDDRYQTGDALITDLDRLGPGPARQVEQVALGPVGREPQRALLATRWRQASTGIPTVVVVRGTSGIGKNRLAHDLLIRVRDQGMPVLTGLCRPDDSAPLAALRRAVLGRAEAADLHVLPEGLVAPEDVARVVTDTARAAGGLVLHLDDVQWIDSATREVLRLLAHVGSLAGPTVPLLIVLTGCDDGANSAAFEALRRHLGYGPDADVVLGPLDDEAIDEIVARTLGGTHPSTDLSTRLAASAAGNPAAVIAYVTALLDAGLLLPSWGEWVLDEAGLDDVRLPQRFVDLVARGVRSLTPRALIVLGVAAVLGPRFRSDVLTAVVGAERRSHTVPDAGTDRVLDRGQGGAANRDIDADREVATSALAEAIGVRLIELRSAGIYGFVHDQGRRAVLTQLGEQAVRRLHLHAAEVCSARLAFDLDAVFRAAAAHVVDRKGPIGVTVGGRPLSCEEIYEVGRHRSRSGVGSAPAMAFAAARAAGAVALAEHAPTEATAFFRSALAAADAAGLTPDSLLWELIAIADLREGRLASAGQRCTAALDQETDRWRRVRLHLRLAQVGLGRFDARAAESAVLAGLQEAGRLPGTGWRPETSGRWTVPPAALASRLQGRSHHDRPASTSDRERQDHLRIVGMLCCIAATLSMADPLESKARLVPARRAAPALAGTGEGAILAATTILVEAGRGHRRAWRRAVRRLDRLAESSRHPFGDGYVAVRRALADVLADADPRADELAKVLVDNTRVLHVGELLTAGTVLLSEFGLRGRARETVAWHDQAIAAARLTAAAEEPEHPFVALAAASRAMLGDHVGATRTLETLRQAAGGQPDGSTARLRILAAWLQTCCELGEFGPPFEEACAELAIDYPDPRRISPLFGSAWVWSAYGAIALARHAPGPGRGEAVPRVQASVDRLAQIARTRILRAHHELALAAVAELSGEPDRALRHLRTAQAEGEPLGAPLLDYEVATARARALLALGDPAAAGRQASFAAMIADGQGWIRRTQSTRSEFDLHVVQGLDPGTTGPGVGHTSAITGVAGSDPAAALLARRLGALQQVSLASATLVDFRQLVTVALDETLRILAAERAMLFLEQDGDLIPYLGRDDAGCEVADVTGYSSTLVTKVHLSGQALVVTGSEEGAALGSRSALVHNLRSILVAPLQIKGRPLGVVYLDSRVAKGIFTADDVDLLVALTNHIALSVETARAARLDADVRVARRQRDLAELLRSSLAHVSAVLDPHEVARRSAQALTEIVPYEGAFVVEPVASQDSYRILDIWGKPCGYRTDDLIDSRAELPWAGAVQPALSPAGDVPPLPGLRPAGWMAIPVISPTGRTISVTLIVSPPSGAYDETQLEIVATFLDQCRIAHQNAHLFSQVTYLATTDALTGLANRRHFFEQAVDVFTTAQDRGEPLTAVMLDVDHFKQINDRYGHATGDETLAQVADRVRGVLRGQDLVGRYGGEEFVALLPGAAIDARVIAERLRWSVASNPVNTGSGPVPVTVSLGVAHLRDADTDLDALLRRADTALYAAKRAGRDRVVVDDWQVAS